MNEQTPWLKKQKTTRQSPPLSHIYRSKAGFGTFEKLTDRNSLRIAQLVLFTDNSK
jgi:hypothetical protein